MTAHRILLAAVGGLTLLLAGVVWNAPARAVTDGVPDGNAHPYVGLVVFYDAAGTPTHRCSGSLLSPTVFLTAGHCTDGAAAAQVWFTPEVTTGQGYPLSGGVRGTPHTHPNFRFVLPNTSDVGVVVLDRRVNVAVYAGPPQLGALDTLATQRGLQEVSFTVVGYGLQEIRPTVMADRTRLQATVRLINLRSALTDGYNIHHTGAPGTGGGTCFGDSGGPVLLGTSHTVVGITSFGLNENCAGGGFAFRTDIATAQSFINSFLTGPGRGR